MPNGAGRSTGEQAEHGVKRAGARAVSADREAQWRRRRSLNEHLAVIEAIRAGDPPAAEVAVRAHLAGVIEALRA